MSIDQSEEYAFTADDFMTTEPEIKTSQQEIQEDQNKLSARQRFTEKWGAVMANLFKGRFSENKESAKADQAKKGEESVAEATTFNDSKEQKRPMKNIVPEENAVFEPAEQEHQNAETESEIQPVSYTEPEIGVEAKSDEEKINRSIDHYLEWRHTHEFEDGVLEPGRAEILVHTTSIDNAANIVEAGSLDSIYNLLTKEKGPRVDRMGGGKVKYVIGATEQLIRNNNKWEKYFLENRVEVIKYFSWIPEDSKPDYIANLNETDNIDDVLNVITAIVKDGMMEDDFSSTQDTRPTNKYAIMNRRNPWSYVANVLPVEARRQIAENAGAEKYASTVLGHAVEGYTGHTGVTSLQAALVYDMDKLDTGNFHSGGGTGGFKKMTTEQLEAAQTKIKTEKSMTNTSEYSGQTEINILDSSENGTSLENSMATFILPISQKEAFLTKTGDTEASIVWFNDDKFRNIDEALGWLTTTSEGQKTLQAINSQ